MSFAANIEKPGIEKYALVVLTPRRKITTWADMGGGVYRTHFTYGHVTSCWIQYGVFLEEVSTAAVLGGQWYYDSATQYLYVGSVVDPTAVGRFVTYEIHLSTNYFRGPRDPLDSDSAVVDWLPHLETEPAPQNGSRDTLYGFNPLTQSPITIFNASGWMNVHLHDSSFRLAVVKSYLMANSNYDQARIRGDIKQTFLGYCGDTLAASARTVSISCVDFFGLLDRQVELEKFTTALAPNCEPIACTTGSEWLIRKVRGRVEKLRPVNVDYAETPSLTDNRKWVVMAEEEDLDEATYTLTVDHTAANTATKTFFTTEPIHMVGDAIAITNDGVTRYGHVTAVDYAEKWITHDDFTGRTVVAGDLCIRYFIGSITIVRDDGTIVRPMLSRDFSRGYGHSPIDTLPDGCIGFIFADDFEANVSMATPLNPATDKIYCTVYGPKERATYADAVTPVGTITKYGGADSSPEALLYWLLRLAGLEADVIDEASLQSAGSDNSAPLGISIPQSHTETDAPSFKDMVQLVLQSALWRLGFVTSGNQVKIGVAPTQPFVSSADYDVDELDHRNMEFEHDYANVYLNVRCPFNQKQILLEGEDQEYVLGQSDLARDLHYATRTLQVESLHYRRDDATELATRLTYAVGDRRGIYKFALEQRFLDKTNIGASYDLIRQDLPGYEFVEGTNRTRQLAAIEVVKSSLGATLVTEDQKGIQDNAGSW